MRAERAIYSIDPEAGFYQVGKWKKKGDYGFNKTTNSVVWLR